MSNFVSTCGLNISKRHSLINKQCYNSCTKPLRFRMMTYTKTSLSLLLLLTRLQSDFVDCTRTSEEYLLKYLFESYNPLARPVLNSSLTVNVNIQFSLLQIQELNVRSQVLTTTGLIILDWVDERLSWDETISDLDEIVVYGGNIWRPEFAVINGAESIYVDYKEFQAVLRKDGKVRWEPGGVFKTMCTIDITFYPFDEQTCHLVFGAWSYYTTKMNLTTDRPEGINLHSYETNGEWEIIDSSVERNEFNFECCPNERFSNINFSVRVRRRPEFYVMNVILPGVLTSTVLLSIFYCIPSQKVHIGSAALLSFRLFLLNVVDTVPRTSDHVPILGIYLTCTMAITTLSIVATVFVGNLYETKDRPVPGWAHTTLLFYAARLLGLCNRCVDEPLPPDSASYMIANCAGDGDNGPSLLVENSAKLRKKWHRQPSYRLVTLLENPDCTPRLTTHETNISRSSHGTDDDRDLLAAAQHKNGDSNPAEHHGWQQTACLPAVTAAGTASSAKVETRGTRGLVRVLPRIDDVSTTAVPAGTRHTTCATHPPGLTCRLPIVKPYAKDWANVAAVCDRLFFWLCFALTVITTAMLFHPLMWRQQNSMLAA